MLCDPRSLYAVALRQGRRNAHSAQLSGKDLVRLLRRPRKWYETAQEGGLPYLEEATRASAGLKARPAKCSPLAPIPSTTCMAMHALGAKEISEWKSELV